MNIPFYNNLSSKGKTTAKKSLIFSVIAIFLIIGLSIKTGEKTAQRLEDNKKSNVDVVINEVTDEVLFEEDVMNRVDKNLSAKDIQIQTLNKDVTDLKEMIKLMALQKSQNSVNTNIKASNKTNNSEPFANFKPTFPPSVATVAPTVEQPNQQLQEQDNDIFKQQASVWVGSIIHEEYNNNTPDKKITQKKRIIHLAPSFMSAYLLTGMDAMTVEDSDDNPEPMMLRVQTPAVLPNDVKAQLEGCFVVAEGYGSLATHRVDARLVSLSCIDYDGRGIINEKIEGYIQDSDGKRGIKGQPVHRAGSLIARTLIAGGAEGIGSALSGAATTFNVSSFGQSSSIDPSKIALSGAGGAINSAAKSVKDLFLQLAKQSTPVIEVGAGKKVDIVITKLVILKIKEF